MAHALQVRSTSTTTLTVQLSADNHMQKKTETRQEGRVTEKATENHNRNRNDGILPNDPPNGKELGTASLCLNRLDLKIRGWSMEVSELCDGTATSVVEGSANHVGLH